jgi:hypothetical protein
MDPVEGNARWHHWTAKGTTAAFSRLIDTLDQHLPAGWKRLTEKDLYPLRTPVQPETAWYAIDTAPSHIGVILSLERVGAGLLRGGKVSVAGPPYPTPSPGIPSVWDQVMRFLDEGIVPAAKSAGVDIRVPSPANLFLSELPSDVRERLLAFSKASRKSLPLSREEAEWWRGFVIAAFRAKAVIDPQRFTDWLVASGWTREAAAELSLLFFDHSQLLSRYAEEVSAA